MPTLEEYKSFHSRAIQDAAEYESWANSRPDAERKRVYEGYAENRRADAAYYAQQIERLERVK